MKNKRHNKDVVELISLFVRSKCCSLSFTVNQKIIIFFVQFLVHHTWLLAREFKFSHSHTARSWTVTKLSFFALLNIVPLTTFALIEGKNFCSNRFLFLLLIKIIFIFGIFKLIILFQSKKVDYSFFERNWLLFLIYSSIPRATRNRLIQFIIWM